MSRPDPAFWRGRRVLVTGHTGFKGSWLTLMLSQLGAHVIGLALEPSTEPSLFPLLVAALCLDHRIADIRESAAVARIVDESKASVVIHLAAQALVQKGFLEPVDTFAVNLTGTLHLLQSLRGQRNIAAALIVTTDKVYANRHNGRRFQETDPLGGSDPYSASKAAVETAVACWRESFRNELPPMATARAGNVIGGGDFASSRLVPDIVRALDAVEPLILRYPQATRPWQHVIDVLIGYLLLAEHVAESKGEGLTAVNFAPPARAEICVVEMVEAFEQAFGKSLPWRKSIDSPPEATRLALDPALAINRLRWHPRQDAVSMVRETADWYAAWRRNENMAARCIGDIADALA